MRRRFWLLTLTIGMGCGTFDAYNAAESPSVDGGLVDGAASVDATASIRGDGATDAADNGDAGTTDAMPSADAAGDAGGTTRRILFMTRGTFNGNLGGVASASGVCNGLAADAGLEPPSGFFSVLLPNTPDAGTDYSLALDAVYYRADGVRIGTRAQLAQASFTGLPTDGGLAFDERGLPVSDGKAVWTGVNADLSLSAANCGQWSLGTNMAVGHVGVPTDNGAWASAPGDVNCDALVHLYCFQTH